MLLRNGRVPRPRKESPIIGPGGDIDGVEAGNGRCTQLHIWEVYSGFSIAENPNFRYNVHMDKMPDTPENEQRSDDLMDRRSFLEKTVKGGTILALANVFGKEKSGEAGEKTDKEKQVALNTPKMKELLLRLNFQMLSEAQARKILETSAEKANTDKMLRQRSELRKKILEKCSTSLCEKIQKKYLGNELEKLTIQDTKNGGFQISSKNYLFTDILIEDGRFYCMAPGQEVGAKFTDVDDVVLWYMDVLRSHYNVTEKE